MENKIKNTAPLFVMTEKRGRPALNGLKYPKAGTFTVNDLVALNPHVKCRLSIYTQVGKMVRRRELRFTGKTVPTGGVGKPLKEIQSMESFRRSKASKSAAKTRKLSSVVVDLTPAPATQPVAA